MTVVAVWGARARRFGDAASQWAALRRKDLEWLRARREFERRAPALINEMQWVFLVGCNNSGTTLIHDTLAATGLFSFMPHEGQRYTSVLRRAHRRGHARVWSEHLEELALDQSDSIDCVPRLVFDWVREAEQPLKSAFLEKTTANAVRMRWLDRAFPRASFIGVVRNGYAVVEGIKRKGRQPALRAIRHWVRVNQIMLQDARAVRRFRLVRYEDFVTTPHDVVLSLVKFLGIDMGSGGGALGEGAVLAQPSPGQHVRDMNAGSISRLSIDEKAVVAAEAADLMLRLGYAEH
jgi:hypothetical protein